MKLLIVVTTHFELDGITNTVMNYYVNMDKTDMQVDFIVPNKLNERLKFQIEHTGGRVYDLTMRKKIQFCTGIIYGIEYRKNSTTLFTLMVIAPP